MIFTLFTAACSFKVGWAVKTRELNGDTGLTVVAPTQQFFCHGELIMWRYQATTSNGFQSIVFRPLNSDHTQYTVVGINNIPAGEINTPVTYNVPKGDRIKVQRGDVIGWSFGVGVLTCDPIPDSDATKPLRYTTKDQVELHNYINFDNIGPYECSIEATFQVSKNLTKFPRTANSNSISHYAAS